jgi:serine protease Do
MKQDMERRVFGVSGFAMLVSAGLLSMGAGSLLAAENSSPPPPLTDAITAPARALSRAFAAVAGHVKPAVVSVYSEKILKFRGYESPNNEDFLGQLFGRGAPQAAPHMREYRIPQRGMGSGMIVDKQGYILTNHHVVQDVDEIKVQLADKRTFEAEVVGTDPRADLAIIRIKGHVPNDLPTVDLGDSDDVASGDLVMAIGAPFGLAQTVTTGIISAQGRDNMGLADFEDFLQTDAPINPGNSGGPLVNMQGQVIGMNTAIAASLGQYSGVSFAIPINMAKAAIPVLIKGGTVQRGLLGVVIQDVTEDLAKHFHLPDSKGALVAQVNKDSAADKAGIKIGDVIVRYDGKRIDDAGQLRNRVAASQPGTKVNVVIFRNGKEQTFVATVGNLGAAEKETAEVGEQPLTKFGLTLQALTPDLAKQLGYEHQEGVLISAAEDEGPAAQAGAQAGDLITAVNREKVANLAELRAVLAKAEDKNAVLLLINRKGASLFIALQVP